MQPRVQLTPVVPNRSRTAKLLRAIVITLVALACLLAATLTSVPDAGAAALSAHATTDAITQLASPR